MTIKDITTYLAIQYRYYDDVEYDVLYEAVCNCLDDLKLLLDFITLNDIHNINHRIMQYYI